MRKFLTLTENREKIIQEFECEGVNVSREKLVKLLKRCRFIGFMDVYLCVCGCACK